MALTAATRTTRSSSNVTGTRDLVAISPESGERRLMVSAPSEKCTASMWLEMPLLRVVTHAIACSHHASRKWAGSSGDVDRAGAGGR